MSNILITKIGAEELKAELNKLKTEDRPAVITAIAEARAHGDLKENAEYHAAKDQQGFIEGRIGYLEGMLPKLFEFLEIGNFDLIPIFIFLLFG